MKKLLSVWVTLICLSGFLPLPVKAAPNWSIPDDLKTIEVNGYPMVYQETGSGIPFVFVHGSMCDSRTWNAQLPEFSKAYRTILVNLRHYYPEKWDGIGDDFSIIQHASDVAALIKKLNLGKVHLLGHSRGGGVVLHVARLYPEVIRTLILEDAGGMESLLPASSESTTLAAKAAEIRNTLRANMAWGDIDKAAREFTDAWNGPGAWEKLPVVIKRMILDNLGTGMAVDERPKISCADIRGYNFPVLLLTGERSPKRYGQIYDAMRQCKPDISAQVVVPNATHTMHGANLGNSGFFNKVVLEFVNQH